MDRRMIQRRRDSPSEIPAFEYGRRKPEGDEEGEGREGGWRGPSTETGDYLLEGMYEIDRIG
jgi:hypothetical protein